MSTHTAHARLPHRAARNAFLSTNTAPRRAKEFP